MAYSVEQIRDKAKQLEAKGAPPAVIEEFVQKATQEAQIGVYAPKEGVVSSLVKGVLRTPARAISTGISAVESGAKLLAGDVAGAQKALEPKTVPFLGELKPYQIGKDVNEGGYFGKETLETIGAGAELGSYAIGSGVGAQTVGMAYKAGGVRAASKLLLSAAKQEAVAGGIGGAGIGLQEEEPSLGNTFMSTLLGAGIGGVAGVASIGVGAGASRVMKGKAPKIKAPEVEEPKLTLREKATGVAPSTKAIVVEAPKDALASWDRNIRTARISASNPRVSTPLEDAGKEAQTALQTLKTEMTKVAKTKKEHLTKAEQEGVRVSTEEIGVITDNLDSKIADRFGIEFTTDETGKEIMQAVPGRTATIDESDIATLTEFRKELQTLPQNNNVQYIDDLVDRLQSSLYKKTQNTALPVNSNLVSFIKETLRTVNDIQQKSVGKSYESANMSYRELATIYEWLNKNIGVRASKGGALMKRVFSPSDAETKTMFEKIRQLTGIDLIREATFAKLAMEIAGDARQKSLLEQMDLLIPGGKNVIDRLIGILKVASDQSGLTNPEKVMRSMIERAIKENPIEEIVPKLKTVKPPKVKAPVNGGGAKSSINKPAKGVVSGMSIKDVSVDPLIAEARKYKSAEEFVKKIQSESNISNQGKLQTIPLNKITGSDYPELDSALKRGKLSLSDAQDILPDNEIDMANSNVIMPIEVVKNSNGTYSLQAGNHRVAQQLINGEKTIFANVANEKGLSIKSQLTDIWNKAHGKKIEPALNLSPEDRAVENKAIAHVEKNEQSILTENEKKNGKVVNADDFRPYFKDVGYNGSNPQAVQEPSSYLAKQAYANGLQRPGKYATLYAGGSGSGKTSAIKNIGSLKEVIDNSAVILDGNLSGFDSAIKKYQQAVDAGKEVPIIYVYRDPVDSFLNGVVKRSLTNKSEMGRIVPASVVAGNHVDSWDVIKTLHKDAGKDIRLIDNSLGANKARLVDFETLNKKIKYPSKEGLTSQLKNKARQLYKQGKISKVQLEGYLK